MSIVPRQRLKLETIQYGRSSDNTFLRAGKAESLLLSMPHHRTKGGGWSGGGPFFQVTDEVQHLGKRPFPGYMRIIWRDAQTAVGCVGASAWFTPPDPKSYNNSWSALQAAAWTYAAKGYHVTRPGNPVASLGQFLAELRDLPKIPLLKLPSPKRYISLFKQGFSLARIMHEARQIAAEAVHASKESFWRNPDAGGEYLNYVFGWKPFVEDLRQIYKLWKTVDKQLAQIIRDNGKGIRRSASLGKTKEVLNSETKRYPYPGANIYGFPGDYINAGGDTIYTLETVRETNVWYSAKYRYYIPDVTDSQWTRRAKLALFGALPTPELVWELVPFSWLIDWAVNVGDVVSNVSTNAVDNLVQEYSFIMRSIKTTTTASATTTWKEWQPYFPAGSGTFTSILTQTIKTRTGGGSPYALSAVNGTALTPTQNGVIAALGLNLMK